MAMSHSEPPATRMQCREAAQIGAFLFADTEMGEDFVEDVFRGDLAGDLSKILRGFVEVGGDAFGGEVAVERGERAADGLIGMIDVRDVTLRGDERDVFDLCGDAFRGADEIIFEVVEARVVGDSGDVVQGEAEFVEEVAEAAGKRRVREVGFCAQDEDAPVLRECAEIFREERFELVEQ